LAQDNLTASLLSQVSARQSYALALAGLRFETGTLLEPSDSTAGDPAEVASRAAINLKTPP
jgi:hypothetical protein